MRRLLPLLLVLTTLLFAPILGPSYGLAQQDPLQASTKTVNVELILDASGSMAETLPGGESRMDAAKRILEEVISGLPERPGVNVGLRVYGHVGTNTAEGKAVSCRASELFVPVAGLDKAALIGEIQAMEPTGWTPIAYSLEQAAADFQLGGESITNAIVLVTDGEETCDPPEHACQAAAALRQAGISVTTHVVGFALTEQQTNQVRCIAEQGGGQLFGAADAQQLGGALSSAIAATGVMGTPMPLTPVAATPPLADIHTLAYHQLTAWTTGANDRGEEAPILSDDGQHIAFARAPGAMDDPANPNRIVVVNADGTGEREVDAYPPLCGCGSLIDLSADGSRIVSSDTMQLRVAEASGGGGRELLALDSNELNAVRITGDGSTIVFRIYRDTTVRGTSPSQPIQRGIYAINPDGSGLRQLVGPDDIAPLLGVTPDQAGFFGASAGLDVSANGAQIVFALFVPAVAGGGSGEGLFAVTFDGSGLRKLVEATNVTAAAVSGDGTRVAYATYTGATSLQEAGVIGFDGGGERKLTDSTSLHPATGNSLPSGERIQLSMDGSRLLLGSTGLLYDTSSGQALALGVNTPGGPGDPAPLVIDGLVRATMDAGATRALYLFQPVGLPYQLARIDLNPADLAGAPTITDARVDPAFVLTETRSTAAVSARVSSGYPFLWVGSRVLRDGIPDDNVGTSFSGPLVDDATTGDSTAGDGLFSNTTLSTNCCAEVGPRAVRVKAETQAGDGLQHATAVDIGPFEVSTTPLEGGPTPATPATPVTTTPQLPTVTPSPTVLPPTMTPTMTPTVLPEPCGPVDFPRGDISFADAVVAYVPVVTADNLPAEDIRDPQQALGPPNFDGSDFVGQAVTLGSGGQLVLQFLDNAIIPDGTAAPDLWIAEVGTEVEETLVEVSADGQSWLPVGGIRGGSCGVDLDAFGFGPDASFGFVRLTDDPNHGAPPDSIDNNAPGADIDAVGAIATGPIVTQPVTPPPVTPPTIAPTATPVPTSTPDPAQATITAQAARIATLEAQAGMTPAVHPELQAPQMILQADTTQVRVGEVVHVRAELTGLGLPQFTISVRDAGTESATPLATIKGGGELDVLAPGTRVLELVEASGEASGFAATLEITLRAVGPGQAEVTVGATGEVCTPDGVCAWGGAGSDPLLIEVSEDSVDVATPTRAEPATETPLAADFVTPDPAACTVTPRTTEEIAALASSPDQSATDALATATRDEDLSIPEGTAADAATTAAVVETYRQMTACFNAGNDLAAYAVWSDEALRQIQAQPPTGPPTPVPEGARSAFRVREVRLLPDGRVVAVWEQRDPAFTTTLVQRLVSLDGRYLVDETVDVVFGSASDSDDPLVLDSGDAVVPQLATPTTPTEPAPSTVLPDGFVGHWEGSATWETATMPVTMDLRGGRLGDVVGTIDYALYGSTGPTCGGAVSLESVADDGHQIELVGTITEDPSVCLVDATVTVSLQADGTFTYTWRHPFFDVSGAGTLRLTRPTP